MENNIYWFWLLSMGSLIFLMQAGFFLLEGGQVRSRDVTNVLMKMTGHLGLGTIVFLIGGFAIKQYAQRRGVIPEVMAGFADRLPKLACLGKGNRMGRALLAPQLECLGVLDCRVP